MSLIRSSSGRVVRALLDDQLQRAAVRPCDRELDLAALGHGDPEAGPERETEEVVGGREVGRVGDGEEGRAVLEDAQRERLVAASKLFGEQRDRPLVQLDDVEVDVLELVLLGEGARDRALGRQAELDHDLAQPLAGRRLRLERAVQLLLGEDASVDQQLAERDPPEARDRVLMGSLSAGWAVSSTLRNGDAVGGTSPAHPVTSASRRGIASAW